MPRQTLKQRADGRYICRCDDRYFLGYTQREVLAAREAYKRDKAEGLKAEARGTTVNTYAAKWLPIARANVGKKTYNEYARMMNVFVGHFAGQPLGSIRTTDLSVEFNRLKGKSNSYIRKYKQLIGAMFRAAQEDGLIVRSPVTSSVAVPQGTTGSHRALEPWEKEMVIASVGQHVFAPAAMLMLFAGLRRGEMLAFNVDRDVDFARGVLHVREAVQFDGNRPVLKCPKTEAGARTVPLFEPLRRALCGLHGLVLPGENGGPMTQQRFEVKFESYLVHLEQKLNAGKLKRWYGLTKEDKEAIAAGKPLPPWREMAIRTHDFRHTFATMLWEASVDLKTAMKWMGHADQTMILRVYAHLTDKKEQEAALKMAERINLFMGDGKPTPSQVEQAVTLP